MGACHRSVLAVRKPTNQTRNAIMNAEELEIEQEKVDAEVKRIAEELNVEVVCDGVILPKHYLSTVIKTHKTLWVWREPHDSDGGYCYKKHIYLHRIEIRDTKRSVYLDPMRYLEYSLKNNLVWYADIPDADKDVEVSKLLGQTAVINIKKSLGGAGVDWSTFWNHVDKFSHIVKRQLEIAKPKIIIATGTIGFFEKYGYLTNASIHKKTYRNYYVSDGRIILDCYHPKARIAQERFCDDIIMALRDAKERGFLNLQASPA